MLQPVVVDY